MEETLEEAYKEIDRIRLIKKLEEFHKDLSKFAMNSTLSYKDVMSAAKSKIKQWW